MVVELLLYLGYVAVVKVVLQLCWFYCDGADVVAVMVLLLLIWGAVVFFFEAVSVVVMGTFIFLCLTKAIPTD